MTKLAPRLCGVARASREWVREYVRTLVLFHPDKFPPYPTLLVPFLAEPKYRIIYRDGRIDGRETMGSEPT